MAATPPRRIRKTQNVPHLFSGPDASHRTGLQTDSCSRPAGLFIDTGS